MSYAISFTYQTNLNNLIENDIKFGKTVKAIIYPFQENLEMKQT